MNQCPICGFKGKFNDFRGRVEARCPKCGSLERHRCQWIAFQKEVKPKLPPFPTILHTAPEPCIAGRLQALTHPGRYLGVDIAPRKDCIEADLRRLPFGQHFVDFVWSSHVLEHIEDAAAAIHEIVRVMKPGALALLDVPVCCHVKEVEKYRKVTAVKNTGPDAQGHWWKPGLDWFHRYKSAGLVIEKHFSPGDFDAGIRPPATMDLILARKP